MNASSVRVVQGKDGIPIMLRDEEPFLIDRWRDVETGNEYINELFSVSERAFWSRSPRGLKEVQKGSAGRLLSTGSI
jgi:hypothetical protein